MIAYPVWQMDATTAHPIFSATVAKFQIQIEPCRFAPARKDTTMMGWILSARVYYFLIKNQFFNNN
jgi:hypothetical protein